MKTETKVIIAGAMLTIIMLVGAVFLLTKQQSEETSVPEDQILSRRGIHWHPNLTILIKGEKQEITPNIGIGGVHQPIHTHDNSGTLHLEVKGLVTKDEIKLAKFFQIWGKDFNSLKILDNEASTAGVIKMTVNGQENKDFENYLMKDGDNIEIKYE